MKIVYCINGVYNSGGMERVLANKANYLADVLGYEVLIVTTEQKGRNCFFTFSPNIRFVDLGINYDDDKDCSLGVRMLKKQFKKVRHRKRLEQVLLEERPDICISMFDRDVDFLYKIKDGSKKILEFHFSKNTKIIESSNLLIRWMQRVRISSWKRMVCNYDRFVVLTEEDKKAWGNVPNITVIPNALTDVPVETATLTEKQVLSVGRICFQKGFDRLIDAWNIVHQSYPDWHLRIRGNGDKEGELRKKITGLRLENSVQLLPTTSQIGEEYLRSSIYVMSSRYEGFGMVLLESMSYGLPVISFACPCGPKDIITDGVDGILCENGNVEQLAKGMIRLLSDADLRKKMGHAAREKSLQFSQGMVMKLWEATFLDTVKP